MKPSPRKIILAYYLVSTLYTLAISFTKTTFVVFLLSRSLTRLDVHLVFSIFTLSSLALEPVTAIYGELFGRRKSFFLGCSIKIVAACLFFGGSSIAFFMVGEIFSGLGATFVSGSLASWMVDHLRRQNKSEYICSVFSANQRYKAIAYILGGLLGAYLGSFDLALPWIAVAVLLLITLIIANILIREDNFSSYSPKVTFDLCKLASGYRQVAESNILIFLMISTFFYSFSLSFPQLYWLSSLNEVYDYPVKYLGWAWVGIASAHFLGSYCIPVLVRIFNGKIESLIVTTILSSLCLLFTISTGHVFAYIVFYILFELFKPHRSALKEDLINYFARQEGRLTVLSMRSLIGDAGKTLGLLVMGFYAEQFGDYSAWYVSCAVLFLSSAIFVMIKIVLKRDDSVYREINFLPKRSSTFGN